MTKIEWRQIPSCAKYEVTADGQIRNAKTKQLLRPMTRDSGHLLFFFGKAKKMYVHRAVLEAFDRLPLAGELGRHLDGNPKNNRSENLAWGTALDNMRDKKSHGRQSHGENHPPAKLTENDVREIRRIIGTVSLRKIAAKYGVSHTAVRRAGLGIKWKHLTGAKQDG